MEKSDCDHSSHIAELVKIVNDNYVFAKCVKLLKDRKALLLSISEDPAKETEILGKLEEVCSMKTFLVLESYHVYLGQNKGQLEMNS